MFGVTSCLFGLTRSFYSESVPIPATASRLQNVLIMYASKGPRPLVGCGPDSCNRVRYYNQTSTSDDTCVAAAQERWLGSASLSNNEDKEIF